MDSHAQKTCNTTTSLVPEVPFIPFLAGLTAWVLLKVSLESIVQRVNPDFFEHLKTDLRRRYDLYFGTWLGAIFKVVSITACTASLFTVSAETDIAGLVRPLNMAEQWCWGCRAIIYIQELPHITSIPELVIHHILSIGAMISILAFNIPRRQMYVAWAGLWSEFVSNARRLFKIHGKLSQGLSWWLGTTNVLLIVAFRVTGCFVAIVWTLQGGTSGTPLIIDIGCWTIYLVYMLQVSLWEASKLKLLVVDFRRPARITIAEKWNISVYGIIMGLAFVCTELSALWAYEVSVKPLSSVDELHSIAWGTLQAVLVGMAGGYLVKKIPIARFRSFTLNYEKMTTDNANSPVKVKRGSMLDGLLFTAAMLLAMPTISDSVDKPALLACVVLSWPLLDAIGYVASHFEGIGPGKSSVESKATHQNPALRVHFEDKPHPEYDDQPQPAEQASPRGTILPLQLIGALLSGATYFSLLAAILTGILNNRYKAALLAFALRTTISSVIIPRRKDIILTTIAFPYQSSNRVELHKLYSLVALVLSITALFWIDLSEHGNPTFTTILGITFVTDLFTPLKWSALLGLAHISFELVADVLSRPWQPLGWQRRRGSGSSGRRGSKGSHEAVHSVARAIAQARRRRRAASISTGRKILKTVKKPKVIASAAGLALVGLVVLAVYSDSMPRVITSVEEARVVVAGSGNQTGIVGGGNGSRLFFVLEVVSSWQFVVSTLGVAVLPVVIVQLMD